MNCKSKQITKEDGYSLVESLIAMSILLAVLVPSAMFLTYIGNNIIAKDKIIAFNYARNQMEYVIATENDSTLAKEVEPGWWVKRTIEKKEDLREIQI